MHACQFCGCACYCGGDIDDCDAGHICDWGCGCDDFTDDLEPITCRCGQIACADACSVCGVPLCSQCSKHQCGRCDLC